MKRAISVMLIVQMLLCCFMLDFSCYAKVLGGDVNQDGKCTSSDALYILNAAIGKTELTEDEKLLCDIDGDGKANSADALLVLQSCIDAEILMKHFKLSTGDKSCKVGNSFSVSITDIRPTVANKTNVVWSSSDSSVASVDANGNVNARKAGKTTVKATSTADNSVTASFVLTVYTNATSVQLNKTSAEMKQGSKLTLTATVNPTYTYNKNLKWTSSNTDIVTVKDGVVKAERIGSATVKCTTTDGSNKSASCEIKVVAMKIPYVDQVKNGYPTGCEAASCCMLLQYYGFKVNMDEMVSLIPRENIYWKDGKKYGPDINEKFVGDPRGYYDSAVPGYGAFSPVIVKALQKAIDKHGGGYTAKRISGCTLGELFSYLRNGQPAIVWATYKMMNTPNKNSWYINTTGKYFSYPKGTHVMILSGYSPYNVATVDPYDGNGVLTFSISKFEEKWNLLGKQAIVMVKNK